MAELYNIQPATVWNVVQTVNQTLPLGQVEMLGTAYSVRVQHTIEDLQRLRALPVAKVGGTIVRVGDVAAVETVYEPAPSFVRVNGEQRILLSVYRRPGTWTKLPARWSWGCWPSSGGTTGRRW